MAVMTTVMVTATTTMVKEWWRHNGQVFIRNSMHVPLNKEAVRDAMPAFFDLLCAEEHR